MHSVLPLYKKRSQTPLQAVEAFREKHPEYANEKLGYAGRLDPMAEGLLLVLVGEENKKRKAYENLTKEYVFDMLPGIATDTYDVLGDIIAIKTPVSMEDISGKLPAMLPKYIGKFSQPLPPYSSQPVNGKPLYYWARRGALANMVIPEKIREIYDMELVKVYTIESYVLRTYITDGIRETTGDFRQESILRQWNEFFTQSEQKAYPVFTLRVSCSSGTYVRSLIHALGTALQTGAVALQIKRTQIGNFTQEDIIA